jgi:hypothetical protein
MTDPGQERPRFARVLSPGEDSNAADLQLTLVLRVMFFLVFVIGAVTTTSAFWRWFYGLVAIVWVYLVADAIRRLRNR